MIAHKCSARVKDVRGQLPLHRAAAVGSAPILKILLEEGKSPVNATDADGLTALHHAVSEGHGDAAILLLKAGAEAEKRDNDGRLAIDLVPDDKVRYLIFYVVLLALIFSLTGQAVHFADGGKRRSRTSVERIVQYSIVNLILETCRTSVTLFFLGIFLKNPPAFQPPHLPKVYVIAWRLFVHY